MIKISVIVPVYNVENYLEKCLDSLINQTLEDIEIIIVNDGSIDNSQEIIDEYVKKSCKIRAFIKENGGLSDARNFGLKHASGEYIGFVDSDDFVEYDMYEILYNKAKIEGSDVTECNLRHTYENSEDIEIGKKIQDKKEMIMYGRSVVWNKIYNREWLQNTGVIFSKGLIYEDVDYFVRLVPHIRKYSYVDEASIHYMQRTSSINNSSTLKTMDILTILKTIHTYYIEQGFYSEYEKALEFLFARILLCSSFLRMVRILNGRERTCALKQNLDMLEHYFPDWRNNPYLKNDRTAKAAFMKTINPFTYRIYSAVFSIFFITNRKINKLIKQTEDKHE